MPPRENTDGVLHQCSRAYYRLLRGGVTGHAFPSQPRQALTFAFVTIRVKQCTRQHKVMSLRRGEGGVEEGGTAGYRLRTDDSNSPLARVHKNRREDAAGRKDYYAYNSICPPNALTAFRVSIARQVSIDAAANVQV